MHIYADTHIHIYAQQLLEFIAREQGTGTWETWERGKERGK